MIKIDITDTQINYLKAIKKYKDENDFYPSVRGLGKILGLTSPATIYSTYGRLTRKGYLKRHERGIYILTDKAKDILEIYYKIEKHSR